MKFVLFFSLWALASSVPLRQTLGQPINWMGLQGFGQETNPLWQQQNFAVPNQFIQQNPELSRQITELLEQGQVQNAVLQQQQGVNPWVQGTQKITVQQIVQLISQQIQEKKQILIQNVIQELKQQLKQQEPLAIFRLQSVNRQPQQQVEIIDAIQQLQEIQSLVDRQVPQNLLVQTLEVAIEAQLVSNNIENLQETQYGQTTKLAVQTTEVFQARIQQLIDQIITQEIQVQIVRQEKIVQQLQQQQQFVNKQKQQIQVEKVIVLQQTQSQQFVQQLQLVQQTLQKQEQQLLQQQVARQLVIQQLQQILLVLQNQLQQDILTEQIKEQVPQVVNPWSVDYTQVSMKNQVPWSQVANLPTSGLRGLNMEINSLKPVISGDKLTRFGLWE